MPPTDRDLNSTMMHFSSKFGNPTWTRGDFSQGQAQNGVNFDFQFKFDLEGQGQ